MRKSKRKPLTRYQFKKLIESRWILEGLPYKFTGKDLDIDNDITHDKDYFEIYCPKHNHTSKKMARSILNRGAYCEKCTIDKTAVSKTLTKEQAYQAMVDRWGLNSQYDLVKTADTFVSTRKDITVYCKIHGPYTARANSFLQGNGCLKCFRESRIGSTKLSQEEFIEEAENVWGKGRWGYDKVTYTGTNNKITIYCPIHHEYFEQIAFYHLQGACGCRRCKPKSKGEIAICKYLDEHGIQYKHGESVYIDTGEIARHTDRIEVDFIINDNIWIEYNGDQHYRFIKGVFHPTYQSFWNQVHRDIIQREMAERQGTELLVISYPDLDRIPEILDAYLGPSHQDITKHLEPVLLPVPLYYYHYGQNKTIEAKGSSIP